MKEQKNVVILQKGKVQIVIAKFKQGYLATVNCLDEEGNESFGCSGDFAENKQDAAYNALDYYVKTWKDAPFPSFLSLIRRLS